MEGWKIAILVVCAVIFAACLFVVARRVAARMALRRFWRGYVKRTKEKAGEEWYKLAAKRLTLIGKKVKLTQKGSGEILGTGILEVRKDGSFVVVGDGGVRNIIAAGDPSYGIEEEKEK